MEYFIQQTVNGLTLGSIYGMIAIGYTMVYGIIGMINFAHGDVFMLGAFAALIAYLILTAIFASVPVAAALVVMMAIAIVMTSLWNWTIERIAYRPLRGSFRLAPLITAIGMSIVLSNFIQVTQGPRNKPIAPMVSKVYDVWGISVSLKQILIVVITIVMMTVFWFVVNRTALGRAQRATEQDRKMAALLGVDVDRTISITFVMGAALAGVAGTMFLMYYGVTVFSDGFIPGVKAFTAAVLGGIGSLPGALLGGLLIGLIESLWSAYFSIDYKDVATFSILAIVLIFKPSGILGRPEIEKV
ncbi:branched-chain amino acid ABC transporter permease [Rhodobacter sp. SGA-6-6]|uniref:branched-chain amino acid ABC transporter permease n=1 Tax=Rhodobacter sp. SGA-6-6 TaxID=2710882 RepID=UPI0013EDD336|nr:branched-chain amino acid ABC transporter permease [Rhodobacter sp. SGA-6-6]NGM45971.1 branched-chain amino acid ABC transporter permease [Rhodobacter sp. SGA-6-6]